METTVGTHVVTSRRYLASGYSLAEVPIERFFGEGIVMRLPTSPGATEINPADLDAAAGDRVRRDDIAVLALAPNSSGRAKLTVFASQWLWDKGVKMLVLDHRIGIGSSPSWNEERTVLTSLFANEIPVVRGATNTDQLSDERFAVMALPMRIDGVEAWPVRVVALDPGEPPAPDPVPDPAVDAAAASPAVPADAEASNASSENAAAETPATATEAEDAGSEKAPAEATAASADVAPPESVDAGGAAAEEAAPEESTPDGEEPTASAADVAPIIDPPAKDVATEPAVDDDAPATDDRDSTTQGKSDATADGGVSDAESGSSPRSES